MGSRIQPVALGASPDAEVNRRLEEAKKGWWKDTEMFGVIGRVPDLLKSIVPVFEVYQKYFTNTIFILHTMQYKSFLNPYINLIIDLLKKNYDSTCICIIETHNC